MAHKTLIGGTTYEITGGDALISGTQYAIKSGKTLVGGTGKNITFKNYPTLLELFEDMTHVLTTYRSSTSTGYLNVTMAEGYFFVFFNGNMSLVKVESSGDSISVLYSTASTNIPTLYKYSGNYLRFSINGTSAASVYGATVMQVAFSTYTDEQIVECFQNASVLYSEGVNSKSPLPAYFSNEYLTNTSIIINSTGNCVRIGIKDTSQTYGIYTIFSNGETSCFLRDYNSNVGVFASISWLSSDGATQIAME